MTFFANISARFLHPVSKTIEQCPEARFRHPKTQISSNDGERTPQATTFEPTALAIVSSKAAAAPSPEVPSRHAEQQRAQMKPMQHRDCTDASSSFSGCYTIHAGVQVVTRPSEGKTAIFLNECLLNAIKKVDALDWKGCVQDCELALNHNPLNRHALMLRAIGIVKGPLVGNGVEQGKAIGAGIIAGRQAPVERYATLVAYGLSERCENEAVERIEELVKADSTDRFAIALLLTVHFKRWYWGEHPESFTLAVRLAQKIQQQWPNDRIAMSSLFYLAGNFGRGNRQEIDFASRKIIPGYDVYPRSQIRPRAVFDYPMHIQRPAVSIDA